MLKSRRGLLAAGLAVAVVGAMGVASTVSAGAEQVPGQPVAESAPQTEAEFTPPPLLPWGERPTEIRRGRPGTSSKSLKAAGMDAAPADASGSTKPRGRYGPKGRSAKNTVLKSEETNVAPPEPPGTAEGTSKVTYLYNVARQEAETDGFYTNVSIAKPYLDKADYHTLAELAVQSADGKQIVEIGWNVDRLVNGDDEPHLFVYHWVDRKTSCYNGCGFQQYSSTIKPGDRLPSDVIKKFGIQYFKDAWWVAYDSEWIGYFPEKLWNNQGITFNRSGLLQVFGEVAATSDAPCTDMGNGQWSKETTAAHLASITYLNGPPVAMNVYSTSSHYTVNPLSARTLRFGGPGNTNPEVC
ncbi:neprosin family prolyl endopeptidase [Paractinoplanes rishiriensis]|uniref:neprosin family prolyl endopeptidase n=1 Tax=Paractinoplanes rishiriensis TaxID=1050105 RepID=UPI001EF16BE3|nr:neprosin family prolyl endopeptidase [Actinoplanes rishiriensis]